MPPSITKSSKNAYIDVPDHPITNLTVEELYDKDKYDLSTMKEDDVFKMLDCSREGLSDEQVQERLEKFGYNRISHSQQHPIIQFLLFMWNPLSWVMEAAAIVAIGISNGGGKAPDWEDFVGILLLLFLNSIIGFVEQRNAGNAVKALMKSLAPEAKVKRNGQWKTIEACELVPGDIISVKLGDIIPADGRLIRAEGQVSIDQAALTGESLPVTKVEGDEIYSGSTCKQGEAEAVVIGTGLNTFFGRAAKLVSSASDEVGHLQIILAKIGNFCIIAILIFIVAEIFVMYLGFRYSYRRGINNILVLLIGGIPIAMPTVLSVTLAIGAKQLSERKAIVTHVTAIEELAAVTILCSDKTGTLTLNKLLIDKSLVKTYSKYNVDEVIHLAAIASRQENQDAIDACITGMIDNKETIRQGIEELAFVPFNPTDKRTEITYRQNSDDSVYRVTKGMSETILSMCTRGKTSEIVKQFNMDIDEFAERGLRALAVAMERVHDDQGEGFELIGLLPIYDPPRDDTKLTIERAIELGVKVKMITGDQLAIAKETGRRLGMGDEMFLSTTLKEGPPTNSNYRDVDDLVLHADGFAGVYPEHKYEIVDRLQQMGHFIGMTGDGVNDAPALSKANVGVAVADASDAARSAADIVLTEPGLSVIIDAILGSRQIFQRMKNYAIYTCSITIRILVGFSVLIFAFKFDFPSFMILVLAILNDGTILTISKDRVKPSPYPNSWNLTEIFTCAIVYGIYLAASTVIFFFVIVQTQFFSDFFGVEQFEWNVNSGPTSGWNHPMLNSIIYLQVSTISQALIFVTRSRSFFFLERPSIFLVVAFCLAQLVATFISVYANWSFTHMQACGWTWAGIVWVWNLVWFFPLDFIKIGLSFYFNVKQKQTIEETLTHTPLTDEQYARRKTFTVNSGSDSISGPPSRYLIRTSSDVRPKRTSSIVQFTAKYYDPYTRQLSTSARRRNFASCSHVNSTVHEQIRVAPSELKRFSVIQTHNAAQLIQRKTQIINGQNTTAV